MNDASRDFLFDLLDTPSPTGFEAPGQRVWSRYVGPFADAAHSDAYGTAWATLEGTAEEGPRLMLDAHVDEIGYMVKHVTDDGFLHVDRIGGSDRAIARAQRVRILTGGGLTEDGPDGGGVVAGVMGNTAIHLRDKDDEKIPEVHDLFVDIGAKNKEEVEQRGVRVGHPMVFDVSATQLTATRISGRAIDNRLGGFIMAEAVRRLSEEPPAATVYATNSVQEEIGGHGARMITHRLRPDLAIAFDVTHATDSPGIDKAKHGDVKMGAGPTVTHGTSNHPALVERLVQVAGEEDLPLQHEASSRRTGTDTDSIFHSRAGVPSALVSVPLRYMHSTVEVVDLGDVEQCINLLVAFARSIREDDSFTVDV